MTAPAPSTPLSPELALVDPALREWARRQLPMPGEVAGSFRRVEANKARLFVQSAVRMHASTRMLALRAVAGICACGAVALVGVRVVPTSAPHTVAAPTTVAAVKPATNPTAAASPKPALPRRFAWAPTDGVDSYRVAFFRGDRQVFGVLTRSTAIEMPVHWRFHGRSEMFSPGEYHWYVWPVHNGVRSTRAVVIAALNIP